MTSTIIYNFRCKRTAAYTKLNSSTLTCNSHGSHECQVHDLSERKVLPIIPKNENKKWKIKMKKSVMHVKCNIIINIIGRKI